VFEKVFKASLDEPNFGYVGLTDPKRDYRTVEAYFAERNIRLGGGE
jgi:hypothetical protein